MKQLKVATLTRDKQNKTKKILISLRNHPEGATPKIIALDTSINVNTVKSLLPNIKGIKKILRGLYKVDNRGDTPSHRLDQELTDWNFHNCILSSQLTTHPAKTIQATYSFKIVNYEFVISKSGRATLRIASDNPLNISSICSVFSYFSELISKHSKDPITPKNTNISSIEFNRDYNNLKLDGVKCLTVDNLVEQFKVYQKKTAMRIEHKTKVAFTVENVIDMLSNNPNSLELNIKISNQKEQIDKLTEVTEKNTELLFKVIDNMKRGNSE